MTIDKTRPFLLVHFLRSCQNDEESNRAKQALTLSCSLFRLGKEPGPELDKEVEELVESYKGMIGDEAEFEELPIEIIESKLGMVYCHVEIIRVVRCIPEAWTRRN